LDVIAQQDFPAVVVPGDGGLGLGDVTAALKEFARSNSLVGVDIAQYNPDKDANGDCANKIIDLLIEALSSRVEVPAASSDEPASQSEESSATV
jgi:arginase family enzyme